MDQYNIYGIIGKTDLLGSFSLHLLYARLLAEYYCKKLAFNINTNLLNFSDTGAQDHYLKNKESIDKHIYYRTTISNALITCNEPTYSNIGGTSQIEDILLSIGFDKVLQHSQSQIRDDVLKNIPMQNYIDTSNLIAIHFRSDEVINMTDRYIHSSNYVDIINELRKSMPEKEIIIFTGSRPPIEHDDFNTFEGLRIICENDNNSPNVLQIWRIFIEANILVTARSGFSYTPALLRTPDQTTYYAKMWHSKPHHWKIWYTN
jgi:hypothetical protein